MSSCAGFGCSCEIVGEEWLALFFKAKMVILHKIGGGRLSKEGVNGEFL